MEERLKRRKLDALKRGVHRVPDSQTFASTTHVVGIGRAGAGAVAAMLRDQAPGSATLSALVVAVGEDDLAELRAVAANAPAESADVAVVSLDVPPREALFGVLDLYPELLAIEYPRYAWGAGYAPWLDRAERLDTSGGPGRAVAKAIYGFHYYGGDRPMERALRRFAEGIAALRSQAVVAVVFGLGEAAGSGIAVDLARHLSIGMFGRAVLVAGIGVAPCDGDPSDRASDLYPVLNELDCLGDEAKNRGVTASCGDLFANPFTAGFILVPQQQAWLATHDVAATRRRVEAEVAALVTGNGGSNLWETLRLLNWVAAPSTQHSAARTPWGARWIHVLGFADAGRGPIGIAPDLPRRMGLLEGYVPEFVEVRVASPDDPDAGIAAAGIADAFGPDVPPRLAGGGREGSVQFILPCAAKTDLAMFHAARDAYDAASARTRLLGHSMLLEQGVLLSERSTLLPGMAGASLPGALSWVAVPFADLRGPEAEAEASGGAATSGARVLASIA